MVFVESTPYCESIGELAAMGRLRGPRRRRYGTGGEGELMIMQELGLTQVLPPPSRLDAANAVREMMELYA